MTFFRPDVEDPMVGLRTEADPINSLPAKLAMADDVGCERARIVFAYCAALQAERDHLRAVEEMMAGLEGSKNAAECARRTLEEQRAVTVAEVEDILDGWDWTQDQKQPH